LVPSVRAGALRPVTQVSRTERAGLQDRYDVPLPTPKSHYANFGPGVTGLPLLSNLLKESDPEIHRLIIQFAEAAGIQKSQLEQADSPVVAEYIQKVVDTAKDAGVSPKNALPKEQALALMRQVDIGRYRPQLLEFLLHQSQVLDLVPPKWGERWIPVVHDAMLYFLDHLSKDRLTEKIVDLAYLPPGTSRGDYMLTFVAKIPSLQKMGQILARNPDLSADYRASLQGLENGIKTISREEMVDVISNDLGKAKIDQYQIQFADKVLAEASVGAIIKASYIMPGTTERKDAIVKIVKPYVLVNLPEDLAILEGLAVYFTKESNFYDLGSTPIVQIFRDIKKALANEIIIKNERQNFINAQAYYKDDPTVLIPEILVPMCTDKTTFMSFVNGEKITASFPGDQPKRTIMAERMNDLLTFNVIFSKKPEAIFHGDPHAGNVQHVLGDKDPYRIALLDWGLYGTFPRQERLATLQLILGFELKDPKRLKKYAGFLFEQGMPTDPAKVREIDVIIANSLVAKEGQTSLDSLAGLLTALVEKGYTTKFSLTLFVKAQLTIVGITPELDPNFDQGQYLTKRATSMVKSEIPKRLMNTVFFWGWNSHSYRSMLSNKDLMDLRKLPSKPKTQNSAPVATAAPQ